MPGLNNRIKFLHRSHTQKEFGELLAVSKATVFKYESDINNPSSDILKEIASVGNKSIQWLFRGDQPSALQHLEHADTLWFILEKFSLYEWSKFMGSRPIEGRPGNE